MKYATRFGVIWENMVLFEILFIFSLSYGKIKIIIVKIMVVVYS